MMLLEAVNVTKRFGGLTAVDAVNFQLEEGIICSIIGPNGAGKSTFFNMITGIYHADAGSIMFNGTSLMGLTPDQVAERGIGRTFQNIRLFAKLNALENVLVGMHIHLHSSFAKIILNAASVQKEENEAIQTAKEILHYVGLKGQANVLSRNMSYGDQRRLEIGRALALKPRLLLLDEPTAGMNPIETSAMVDLFRKIRDDFKLTIILIEHDMKLVMRISENIMVLDCGAKIAEGKPEAIKGDKRVIEAYLGRSIA